MGGLQADAKLIIKLDNQSDASIDRVVMQGGTGLDDALWFATDGVEPHGANYGHIEFDATICGDHTYDNTIFLRGRCPDDEYASNYFCSVTLTTKPTYEFLKTDRVYPVSTTSSDSGDSMCALKVNSAFMITITILPDFCS